MKLLCKQRPNSRFHIRPEIRAVFYNIHQQYPKCRYKCCIARHTAPLSAPIAIISFKSPIPTRDNIPAKKRRSNRIHLPIPIPTPYIRKAYRTPKSATGSVSKFGILPVRQSYTVAATEITNEITIVIRSMALITALHRLFHQYLQCLRYRRQC